MTAPLNSSRTPPYKLGGLIFVLLCVVIVVLVLLQFRGTFEPKTELTMMSDRSGLSMDPGSKVTYNGVEIGRVGDVTEVTVGDTPKAKITLDVNPKYIHLIPQNVDAKIQATTVFGNKYMSFTSPKNPVKQRITSGDVIDVSHVTTEFNTLFETLMSVSEKVDPIKLNQTLTATAQALQGLGDRFGQSIINGNQILDDINPQMPQIRRDNQLLADLGEMYADAAPDLFDGLSAQRGHHRAHPQRAAGQHRPGADGLDRVRQHRRRHLRARRPVPDPRRRGPDPHAQQLLDEYSPGVVLHHPQLPRRRAEDRGFAWRQRLLAEHALARSRFAGNAYVYPDNLPRVNAKGGPEGRPGLLAAGHP